MKQTIYMGCSFIFKPLCSLVVLRVLAGTFGEAGFGYLTQYMSFLAVVFGLALGGANNYLVKNLSQAKSTQAYEREISVAFSYGLLFFCLLSLVVIGFKSELEQFVFYKEVSWWVIVYILTVFMLSNISGVLMSVVLAQGKTNRYVLSNAGGALLFVTCVLTLVFLNLSSWVYWILPLSYVLPGVFLYKSFNGKIRIDFGFLFESRRLLEVFRFCLIVYVGLVSIPVVSMLLRENFSQHFGAVELSYWQAAVKISDTIQQFYGMFCAVILLPYLSRKLENFNFREWLIHLGGVSAIFVLGACMTYALRKYIISLLFGEGYSAVANYLPLYLIGDYFRAIALFCSFTMIAAGRYSQALVFEALQGVVFVGLYNVMLGRKSVDIGSVYISTYAFCFVLMFVFVYQYFKRRAV
ncbi:oligosaccharide flippase family protein [Pseudomonas sp. NA-150]|uniref:oligosaccharide flippase family protein n=1 Tax=Pseudomonas sp. NA-150 TaxID=3367525 RepID=UPI0037C9CC7D